jgi:hypothetical protein
MRTAVHGDDAKSVHLLRQDRDVLGSLNNVYAPASYMKRGTPDKKQCVFWSMYLASFSLF